MSFTINVIFAHVNIKSGKAIDYMIRDALLEADSVLKISDSIYDANEYLKMDDTILNKIEFSDDPVSYTVLLYKIARSKFIDLNNLL